MKSWIKNHYCLHIYNTYMKAGLMTFNCRLTQLLYSLKLAKQDEAI